MIIDCSPPESTTRANQSQSDASQCPASVPTWHRRFLELLPKIRRHAQIRFRSLPAESCDDLVQETIARALLDYLRLVAIA